MTICTRSRLAGLLLSLFLAVSFNQGYSQTQHQQSPAFQNFSGSPTGPKIWLQDRQLLQVVHTGTAKSVQAMKSAQPLALAEGDFDVDGVEDLVVGYASPNGGILALHRGNLDAFAPQSDASFHAIARGKFPSPFLPNAKLIELPVRPDFVSVGSFNGNGYPDVVVAARGDSSIYLLTNDGKGNFGTPKPINVGGSITTLAAGDVGRHGIYSKLLVGISDRNSSYLMVYTGTLNGLGGVTALSLHAPASNIVFGHLGDIGPDALFVSGGQVMILHSSSMRLEALSLPVTAQSIALGSFIWDRNPQMQIAVMDSYGNVHIAAHSEFDPRSYTTTELQSLHRIGRGRYINPLARPKTVPLNGWKIVETLSGIAPSSGPAPVLLRTRISDHGADDVMVLNGYTGQMTVIAHPDAAPGSTAFTPGEISSRPYNGSPAAALAMRTNVDGRPGIVSIHQGQVLPSVMMPLPDPTFFPNRTDDPTPTSPIANACNNTSNTDTSSSCSLREAILKANATAGTDTIMLAAETYTLSIPRQQDNSTSPPTVDYSGNHGALYVNDSLTITGQTDGSGNPTSIIQAGTDATNGVDMVMAVNEDINPLTNATASISNVVLQFGRNTGSDFATGGTAATQDGDGGCMEFDTGTSGNANLTLTNVILQHCTTTNGDAGGIVLFNFLVPAGTGGATITDSIIQNNAPHIALVGAGGGFGGGIGNTVTGNIAARMVLTNSKVINNNATEINHSAQGVAEAGTAGGMILFGPDGGTTPAIHNSIISGNSAAGEAGGIFALAGLVIDQGSVISNNSAGSANSINNVDGGGIYANFFQTDTLTISKATITGNSTTGNGGGIRMDDAGGTLNISFSRIVGNTAGGAGNDLSNRHDASNDTGSKVTAQNNWWGTNTPDTTGAIDPNTSTCPAGVRQICFDPWIKLTNTASPAKIRINQSSTLTADMSKDNHGNGAALAGNLDEIVGLSVTFDNPVLGTIPNAQPEALNSNAQATATYNAGGTGGKGSADATVDQQTVTADIVVLQPPSLTKSFSPTTVAVNTASTTTFSITNPNTVTIDSSFTDSLPTGLVVATTPAVSNGCGGTVTATAGAGSISFANAALPVGTCSVSVNVQSSADATYTNSVTIDSSDAGNGNTSSASLTVINPPSITKTFGASTIPMNGTTSLSFSISNSNVNTALSGIAFTDSLPAGLVVATPNGLTNNCGGTPTAVAGASSVSLTGATQAASASCTVSVNVQGTTGGVKNNSVQVTSTNGGTGNTSNASVTVVGPPSISKAFGAASIPLNGSTSLSFTIQNPNASNGLSGVGFSDTLPSGLVVSTPNGLTGSCGGGTITDTQGTNVISLSGATLAGSASCTFAVNVTGSSAGQQSNTTGAVTSTEGGTGNTASASTTVVAPPSIAKAFNPSAISVNATSSLTFTITNPAANTVAEAGVAFTDTLPTGLTVASGTTTVCGGTLTTTTPTGIALSGASIAVNSQCQFSVTVTGAASGQYTNTTGNVTSTNGGTGNTASAGLTVASPPSIAKAFGAASIPLNGTTSLTFTINNPNTNLALTGIAFTDALPAGLVVATPNGLTNNCGGTATAVAGASSVSLSAGTLASSASCTISANITGTTAGVKNNSVQVTSTEAGTGNTSNASITVVGPPTISKSFGASSVPLNGSTSLSFTIHNNNTTVSLSGVAFSDTLPAGLLVSTPNGLTGSCGSGTITATQGTNGISLSGATLAASASCTFSVNVTGTSAGQQNNTTSAVTSTEGGTGNTASASLTVIAPPSIAKSFNPSTISVNATSSLTFTITNPAANTTSELGVAFTDTLPTGLSVTNATATVCGGTLTTTAPTVISLSGASITTAGQCQFSVTVTGTASGQYTNTSGAVTSTNGGTGNTASANLTVATPPSIVKAFGAARIPLNGTTSLSFNITNPNSGLALAGLAFADTLPAGLVVASVPNLSNSGCGGTATAVAGSSSVSLSGGTLAASASCTINVNVTGTTPGVKNNSVTVSSTNAGTGNTSNASITVVAPPVIIKAFGAASIPLTGSTSLTFTIQNNNTTQGLSGIQFTDTLPAGLVVSLLNGLTGSCGGGTITATPLSKVISLSGGSLAASASCTFAVNVTGTSAGQQNNTTGAVTSTEGGTGGTASASITVIAPPSIAKAFNPASIAVNSTTSLGFTITNPAANTLAETGVVFTDVLPTGITVASGSAGVCGGTLTTTAPATITLSGATIATNSKCTFNVTVKATQAGQFTNRTGPVSSTNGGTGNIASANLIVAGVVVSPTSINFGDVDALHKKTAKVTVTNRGTTAAPISVSITPGSGANAKEFTEINGCPGTLPAGKSCIVLVSFFAPTPLTLSQVGVSTATLNVISGTHSQHVALRAKVIDPEAHFQPTSLAFGEHKVGSSTMKTLEVTNVGLTTLTIDSVSISGTDPGDFSRTNLCPSSLAPGKSCQIQVTFRPMALGNRFATLVFKSNDGTDGVPLSGSGD
jgi:uncharacterized repeat protein (TIGR01451 family)